MLMSSTSMMTWIRRQCRASFTSNRMVALRPCMEKNRHRVLCPRVWEKFRLLRNADHGVSRPTGRRCILLNRKSFRFLRAAGTGLKMRTICLRNIFEKKIVSLQGRLFENLNCYRNQSCNGLRWRVFVHLHLRLRPRRSR